MLLSSPTINKVTRALVTTAFWHGPWVRKIAKMWQTWGCAHFVDEKVCFGCFQGMVFTRTLCAEARKHWPQWEMSNLPNAKCAPGLLFNKLMLVLVVCQPTKVRRKLLGGIETEKGKGMIMMVMMMMMRMLLDDMKVLCVCVCRGTIMMMLLMMKMAGILMMLIGLVAKLPPPPPLPPTPASRPRRPTPAHPPNQGRLKPVFIQAHVRINIHTLNLKQRIALTLRLLSPIKLGIPTT